MVKDTEKKLRKYFLDQQTNSFDKEYITGAGLGITVISNETKYIINVIGSQKTEEFY